MSSQSVRLLAGTSLIFVGLVALVGAVFQIRFGELCFPLGLIIIGLFLFFRPHWSLPNAPASVFPIGEINRTGPWEVKAEEIWTFVSDISLDFTQAVIPEGETTLRLGGFVTDIDITVPQGVGVALTVSTFVMDATIRGQKRETFASSFSDRFPGYDEAPRRLKLEISGFVMDLRIDQAGESSPA